MNFSLATRLNNSLGGKRTRRTTSAQLKLHPHNTNLPFSCALTPGKELYPQTAWYIEWSLPFPSAETLQLCGKCITFQGDWDWNPGVLCPQCSLPEAASWRFAIIQVGGPVYIQVFWTGWEGCSERVRGGGKLPHDVEPQEVSREDLRHLVGICRTLRILEKHPHVKQQNPD